MALKFALIFTVLSCLPFAFSLTACPDGWTKYHRSCYLFPNIQAAWGTALTICRALRPTSKLVEIETAEENNFLESHLRDLHTHDSYWTGGNDIENENEWIWATSRTKFGFEAWDKSDPNNVQPNNLGHHEDCMELNGSFSDHWHDADCSSKIYFICEIELEDPVPGIVG